MSYKVCNEPGCFEIVEVHSGPAKCEDHRRLKERTRGSRQQRGYGTEHDKARSELVKSGATHCTTCGEPFTSDNPMTAGHVVAQRNGGTSADGYKPECLTCNYGWRRTGS